MLTVRIPYGTRPSRVWRVYQYLHDTLPADPGFRLLLSPKAKGVTLDGPPETFGGIQRRLMEILGEQ